MMARSPFGESSVVFTALATIQCGLPPAPLVGWDQLALIRKGPRHECHAVGGGPRSCDLGTKQLTRLSRSGGAVGREGGFIGRGPVPWMAADD